MARPSSLPAGARRRPWLEALEDRCLLSLTPQLLKDLNRLPESIRNPEALLAGDGVIYFTASDTAHGRELWKTDGTEGGTVLVRDLTPGADGSRLNLLGVRGDVLYFTFDDGTHGEELWKSDGTAGGTALVKDINPFGDGFNAPPSLTDVGGTLFFAADDGVHGRELWKTDGTEEGTALVKDINPFGGSFDPPIFTPVLANVGGTLYFVADDGEHGVELWKSDGTEEGTALVKDINALGADGPYGSFPSHLTDIDGTLYFAADDGEHGVELWKSDGTEEGTALVRDINPGRYDGDYGPPKSSFPSSLTAAGGMLFFAADDGEHGAELWASDGTEDGTALVRDINPGGFPLGDHFYPYGSAPYGLTAVGGVLFFAADDGEHGTELWRSDGTEGGTALAEDINPGAPGSFPSLLTAVGGRLFFAAFDDTHGQELWASDGTAGGTALVEDIAPGYAPPPFNYLRGSGLSSLTVLNGTLFFTAEDGSHGRELWHSDGTEVGTARLAVDTGGVLGSAPAPFVGANGITYFVADDGVRGRELWRTDGTEAGTALVKDINPGDLHGFNSLYSVNSLTNVNGTLYFVAEDVEHGRELWKTDGTEGGTVLVRDINPGGRGSFGDGYSNISATPGLTAVNGTLFFVAYDPAAGFELWASDGTEAGTALVRDILPGRRSSYPQALTSLDGLLFFVADDGRHGEELWKSDGTAEGTALVKDVRPGSGGGLDDVPLPGLWVAGGLLVFAADDGTHGREPWVSDGTAAGTMLLHDVRPGEAGSDPVFPSLPGETIFFAASDGMLGRELWASDGTPAGTRLVKDINLGPADGVSALLGEVNGVFHFVGDDGEHGAELWRSGGTEEDTSLVKDIRPGGGGSSPSAAVASGGTLFFAADDGRLGRELWASDGTDTGTRLVLDILPGGGGSDPSHLAVTDNRLFLAADDGSHGREPWRFSNPREITDRVLVERRGFENEPRDEYSHGSLGLVNAGAAIPGPWLVALWGVLPGLKLVTATVHVGDIAHEVRIDTAADGTTVIVIPRAVLEPLVGRQALWVHLRFHNPLSVPVGFNTRIYSDPFGE